MYITSFSFLEQLYNNVVQKNKDCLNKSIYRTKMKCSIGVRPKIFM